MYIHVTLVPFIEAAGELKTKPTQHSVNELRRIGIHPDVIVCRSHEELVARHSRQDRALRRRRPRRGRRVPRRPRRLSRSRRAAGGRARPARLREARPRRRRPPTSASGTTSCDRIDERRELVEIALVGKYVKLQDAYLSVHEALKHAGLHNGCSRAACAGSMPRTCRTRRRRSCSRRSTACSSPAASARAAGRGRSSRAASRARTRHPVPRHLPRHACRRLRVRTARRRSRRRQLDRDGSRDAVPGDRPAAGAEGRSRISAGRCGSARRRSSSQTERGARALRRRGHLRAPPAPLRGQQPLPRAARRPPGSSSAARSRKGGSSRSSSFPTIRGSSRASSIRSSSRGPTRPAPLFRGFVGAALARARERADQTAAVR